MLSYLLFLVQMIVLINIYPAYQHQVRIFNYFSKKVRLKSKDIGKNEELVEQLQLKQDKNASIFNYLQRDCGISYNKLQKMKSSSMYLSSVDYKVQYLPMLQALRELELSSDDIRWIIIRNPQIFFLSPDHIYDVVSYLQSSSHFSGKEVLSMVVKKPLILSKTIEEIRQFLDFFLIQLKYNSLSQDKLGNLLLKKPSLWDCSAEDLSEYLDVLQSIYCLEIDDIQEMLLDRSCYLFSKDLIENIAERIEVLVSYCGAFRNIRKWKQICRACPRLLLLPPTYLQNYLNILREELRFDSMTSFEFHQFLQVSARIFYFSDLTLVRLRCRSNFGFLTGSHFNESNNHLSQENLSSKFTKRQLEQIMEEARFYESYLSHLSHRSRGDDTFDGSFYVDWISEIVRSSNIDFISSARNKFLKRSSNISQDELGDSNVWKQLCFDQKQNLFLSNWFEMDALNLSRADSLTLISSGKLLSFPFKDILHRTGLLAVSLGLNATEMTHVIRYQPAVLTLSFDQNLFLKLEAVGEAAYRHTYLHDFEAYRQVSLNTTQVLQSIQSDQSLQISRLKQLYREHPIRRKVREFVMQSPKVLAYNLRRYDEAIDLFFENITISKSWKRLNPTIMLHRSPVDTSPKGQPLDHMQNSSEF